jgi:hypothetical protein
MTTWGAQDWRRVLVRNLLQCIAVFAVAVVSPAAFGQTTPTPQPPAPRIGKVAGSTLQAGRWTYESSVTQNGKSQSLGSRTLTVTPSTYHGAGAWLIVEARAAGAMSAADSLYVTKEDMSPLHRAMHMGVLHIENDFSGDSVTGTVRLPQGSVPVALASRPGLMANGNMLEVILQLLPLRKGWTGSADMLVLGPEGAGSIPVQLEVTGEEQVTVPAGTFDSWIAVVKGNQVDQRIWLAKNGRRIVKVTFGVPQVPGAVAETVLTASAK